MSGTSTQSGNQVQAQQTSQNQQQQTTPWATALPTISGALGNLGNINPNVTGGQQSAIDQLIAQGQAGSPFTGGITNTVNSLLAGGGANTYAPLLTEAYNNLSTSLSPITDPNNLNPYNTPGFADALKTATSDISNQIGGSFAAAGRDPSGNAYGPQSIARGVLQGISPTIAGQYNQNVQNLMNAGSQLFGAGTSTAGGLLNMNQAGVGNEIAGITSGVPGAESASTYGPLLQLSAMSQSTGIPLANLAQIMGIGLPAAQAFGQTTGTGTGTSFGQGQTNQSYTMSPAQQFALLSGSIRNLFPGSGGTTNATPGGVPGITNFLTG